MIVLYTKELSPLVLLTITFFLLTLNYLLFDAGKSLVRYFLVIFSFSAIGYIHDTGLITLQLISRESYNYSYLLLWTIFIAYYNDIFRQLENRIPLQIFLGAVGGFLAYYSALNLNAWKIEAGKLDLYILYSTAFWTVFFPTSFVIYEKIIHADKYKSKLK